MVEILYSQNFDIGLRFVLLYVLALCKHLGKKHESYPFVIVQ